jgi:hypothetical protein
MKRSATSAIPLLVLAISLCLQAFVESSTPPVVCAGKPTAAWSLQTRHQTPQTENNASTGEDDDDEDDRIYSLSNTSSRAASSTPDQDPDPDPQLLDLTDLTPPTVNLVRDSILFSENPSTLRNNSALDAWKAVKSNWPAVLTGAWPWKDLSVADKDPVGALYNIAMVRMPVVLVGLLYGKNLIEGHPLVMDIGDGPFVMNPLIVICVLGIILA